MEQTIRHSGMVLTDETCDILCKAAQDKSREMGLDISFAIADADEGNLMGMHTCNSRITLVPGGFPLIADGKVVGNRSRRRHKRTGSGNRRFRNPKVQGDCGQSITLK